MKITLKIELDEDDERACRRRCYEEKKPLQLYPDEDIYVSELDIERLLLTELQNFIQDLPEG